jgi:hypothetical protein
VGLQVKIFRREVILKVGEVVAKVEVRWEAVGVVCGGCSVAVVVGEEVGDVEGVRGEERGRVTSKIIVFKIIGVGGREKPAFKDIAICVNGR